MMKYRLHIASLAIAALPLLTSCSDSYPGLEYPIDDSHVSNNESLSKIPVMVFINPQNFFSVSATRATEFGTGTFDPASEKYKRKYGNSDFYVYAFRTTVDQSGPLAGVLPDLKKGRWDATDEEEKDGRYCLVDGPGGRGLRARLTADEPGALSFDFGNREENGTAYSGTKNDFVQYDPDKEHDHVRYFSPRYQNVTYNFFGYYIDNVDSVQMLNRTTPNGDITYEFDIDGSQDIMCGYAPFTKDNLDRIKLTTSEYETIWNAGGFTTYAAHRSVYPEIKLGHQLVRLDFSALPGDKGADDITITKISVDCPKRCVLTVASTELEKVKAEFEESPLGENKVYVREESVDGLEETGDFNAFCLADRPVSAGQPNTMMTYDYVQEYRDKYGENPEPIKVGGSLLVPEAEKYHVTLEFKQKMYEKLENGERVPAGTREASVEYELSLGDNKKFEKGYYYPIQISVFGYREIEMTADIIPWKPGGGVVVVDPDDEIKEKK